MLLTWGMGGGFAGNGGNPSFALGFADLGNGAVDTSSQGVAVAPTFTRATAAATKLSTGLWKLDVATGVARSTYLGATTAVGAYGGYFAEGSGTQLALNPRDMTQAAWVAVNVTPAQTATGIDGVTNSATRLTSAAIGASILQTLVAAATSRTYSVWLRRVTGTGTITISQGATTLDVTASLNSSTFTRVELNASVLNSAFGITFGASGDVIEADCNQFEAGAFATSPIPAAGTRNADVLTYPLTGWFNASNGSLYAQSLPTLTVGATRSSASISDGTANEVISLITSSGTNQLRGLVTDGGVNQAVLTDPVMFTASVKYATAYAVNDFAASFNGGAPQTDSSGTLPTPNIINIGTGPAGAEPLNGSVRSVAYWPRRLSDQQLQVITS